jgi:hypothetical protein
LKVGRPALDVESFRMPEVQRSTQSSELTQTFLQFVLMHTQQALFALGKHPKLPPNAPPPNLALGKMYVDHLIMLRWKTQGNLDGDETSALNHAITHLQNAFVEATQEAAK